MALETCRPNSLTRQWLVDVINNDTNTEDDKCKCEEKQTVLHLINDCQAMAFIKEHENYGGNRLQP